MSDIPLFLYGTLRHAPLFEAVAGRGPMLRPAHLPDYAPFTVLGEAYPALRPAPGDAADGVLARGLSEAEEERVAFYEGDEFRVDQLEVQTDAGPVMARVFVPTDVLQNGGVRWDYDAWRESGAGAAVIAADEMMHARAALGDKAAWENYTSILVRAHSKVRARTEPAPTTLRRAHRSDEVKVAMQRQPYAGFFAVGEAELTHPVVGGQSDLLHRSAFLMGDAVTILPYDPVRDRVLVIDQFRFGVFLRGDPYPWSLEPIAGRIDPGESPEVAARREAKEEAGLDIRKVHQVGRYYPSPAGVSEWLASYVGIADLPDGIAGVGGCEDEHEDIVSHVIPFDHLMELVESGEAANAPLLLTAYWLEGRRASLA
ncbi:MAG: NUDIX domain-containing protein [Pseudomonadota bacterium]